LKPKSFIAFSPFIIRGKYNELQNKEKIFEKFHVLFNVNLKFSSKQDKNLKMVKRDFL